MQIFSFIILDLPSCDYYTNQHSVLLFRSKARFMRKSSLAVDSVFEVMVFSHRTQQAFFADRSWTRPMCFVAACNSLCEMFLYAFSQVSNTHSDGF